MNERPIENYLADDHTFEVMVIALLEWREKESGAAFFDGKSSELAVFIINALQTDIGVPDDRKEGEK